jgi:serine/threonine-protein kinase PknG
VVGLEEAGRIVDALTLEPARRAALTADVLECALPLVVGDQLVAPSAVLGYELTEADVRRGLERAYRTLARFAETTAGRIELVDRANRVRRRSVT